MASIDVKLRPFRDIDEHDVIGLFAHKEDVATQGAIVTVDVGWKNSAQDFQRNAAGATYNNTLSNRYSTAARVDDCASGEVPLGMLLNNVAETDENGEKYLYREEKKRANQVSISGETVPVATKGIVLYSGVWGTPAINGTAYVAAGGYISTSGTNTVGKFLGLLDDNNHVLIKLDM